MREEGELFKLVKIKYCTVISCVTNMRQDKEAKFNLSSAATLMNTSQPSVASAAERNINVSVAAPL